MGLLFKSKKEKGLIALQNYLFNMSSSSLSKTPKQILNSAQSYIKERSDKIHNAAKKIESADEPQKLFESIARVQENVRELKMLDDVYPGTVGGVEEIKAEIEKSSPDYIDSMIDRCWEKYRLQALKLSREDSKKKKLNSFFEMMDIYSDRMYSQNIDHIQRIKHEFDNNL